MESTPAASAAASAPGAAVVSQPTTGFGASSSEEIRERRKKLWEGLESKRCQTDDYATLRDLVKHHIESFDYFVDTGLENALQNIRPVEVVDPKTGGQCRIWFGKHELQWPQRETSSIKMSKPMFPQECRESKTTYRGRFIIEVHFEYNGGVAPRERFHFGYLPIMLMSKRCHLRSVDTKKLTSCREEATEMGGYFICGGLEKLCRLLILPKGNYPMGMLRKSYVSRGDGFTDKAVSIRCVRGDQSSVTVKLYYLQNGSARVGFWLRMREYLLPVGVVLKALIDTTDREIYANLTSFYNEKNQKMKGAIGTQLVGERAKIILDEVRDMSLLTRMQCVEHIGECFQPVMYGFDSKSHFVVGEAVLRDFIFVHLGSNHDKFNLLIFMLQKLFALVDQTAAPDSADALQNQEVLLVGHLLTVFLKEKLELWLEKSRRLIQEELVDGSKQIELANVSDLRKLMDKSASAIGNSVESLIKTGKLSTLSGLDLPQREGMTISAERLNFLRFLSHFRSVHRGASFAKMRTTSVRKLLPESWGFLCPVHTPDGTPCGLLNHMTATCRVTSFFDRQGKVKDFLKIQMSILTVLVEMGMIPFRPKLEQAGPPEALHVLLDGRLVGSIPSNLIEEAVAHLRKMKLSLCSSIPDDLEVGYVPLSYGGAYPGLYLFTSPSRFVRPVRNVTHAVEEGADIELIGPFEQAFMEISCPDGGSGGRSDPFPATHEEIHPTGILSIVANLTPWSDHNQSPRNMYQCQMGKQTLGFSAQALQFRSDNKSYHLQTPQSPIVRTEAYDKYCVDEFPLGTNAIVAVLAYSGYDMEDAMILNKSSVERGLCRGHIYQTQPVDLETSSGKSGRFSEIFVRGNDKQRTSAIDSDGLPYIAQMINPGETLYTTQNLSTNRTRFAELKGTEPAYVDYVAVDGSSSSKCLQKVNIRLRKPRNPVIGDKFSSRHGQKGVCSQLWPDTDMPFSSVTGMRPDLIINPHAFPSRMTIAMLLESIAAKGGSLSGSFVDATPFASCRKATKDVSATTANGDSFGCAERKDSSEPQFPLDNLGPLLASYGFNYHGLEVMHSGVLGTELVFEIFIGPVYYQRLRHMVSDKYQVRSTGTIDQITKQPIGGRKRGGGIRFGEMERDAMLAHGAAYLLHDRLHTCSDYHIADVCSQCGSVLTSSTFQQQKRAVREVIGLPPARAPKAYTCVACKTSKGMETVAMPYVFRYLTAELAAMNIKVSLQLNDGAKV